MSRPGTGLLITVEERTATRIAEQLRAVTRQAGATVRAAGRRLPGASGAEVTSDAAVHAAFSSALGAARSATDAALRAGFRAAAHAGHSAVHDRLGDGRTGAGQRELDADLDTGYLDAVLADVSAAFDTARVDLPESVRAAIDAGSDPADAADRAVRRLGVRVYAAATVAVNRGYTEGQLAAHTTLAADAGYLGRVKRWEVTSDTPCPACAALHGSELGVDEPFDADAGSSGRWTAPRVYRDLQGPPRHPNCRCRLVLGLTAASTQLRQQISRPGPDLPTFLSAADIRRLPAVQYQALVAFLTAANTRLAALLQEIRDGG